MKKTFKAYTDEATPDGMIVGKEYLICSTDSEQYILDEDGDKRELDIFIWEEGDGYDPLTGDSVDYYSVKVTNPISDTHDWYVAECYDLIKALKLTWEEANILKEIWRTGNERNNNGKSGNTPLRSAEKIHFFAKQNLNFIKED